MPVSREFKARMRARYAHLYAPTALAKLYEQAPKEKKAPFKPLPRGATLPQAPKSVPHYLHSADRPPVKLA
jgi:hypothetical protein